MELVRRLDPAQTALNNEDVSYEHAGPKLIEWRRRHNEMSQIEFAKLAGVSVGCLQGLETGTRATRDVNLDKIAKAMGMTRKELLSPEESARPPATDPRLKNLTAEDLQIAHLFHEAFTEVWVSVKTQLRTAVELARKDAELEGRLFPDVIDRRSGRDRRQLAADAEARLRQLQQRLAKATPAVITQLEALLDAGGDEWSIDFATRVARQADEIRTVLENHLAHVEKRETDNGLGNEKKSGSKKKP